MIERVLANAPNETDMNAHIAMSAGTIKTDIYTICNTSPCRISRLTIKARLVSKKFSWVQIKQIERLTLLPFCALSTLKNSSVSCFVGSAIGSNGPGALGLFLVCDSDLMWLNQVSEVTVLGVGTSETRKPFEGQGECMGSDLHATPETHSDGA